MALQIQKSKKLCLSVTLQYYRGNMIDLLSSRICPGRLVIFGLGGLRSTASEPPEKIKVDWMTMSSVVLFREKS